MLSLTSRAQAFISLDAIAVVAKQDALSLIRWDTEVKWHEKHQCVYSFIINVFEAHARVTGSSSGRSPSPSRPRSPPTRTSSDSASARPTETRAGTVRSSRLLATRCVPDERLEESLADDLLQFADLSEFGYGVALLNDCKCTFLRRSGSGARSLLDVRRRLRMRGKRPPSVAPPLVHSPGRRPDRKSVV